MTPELAAAIINLLKASAAVAAVASTRIYPQRGPQGVVAPYVVVTEIVSNAEESHDDANGLDATQIQLSCYASTALVAITLRKAVRAALLADGAMPGVKVTQPISRILDADEQSLANAIIELTFMHNPST